MVLQLKSNKFLVIERFRIYYYNQSIILQVTLYKKKKKKASHGSKRAEYGEATYT